MKQQGNYRLGQLLSDKGLITPNQLEQAIAYQAEAQKQSRGLRLGEVLVELGFVSDRQLSRALKQQSALRICAACVACVMTPFSVAWGSEKPEPLSDWEKAELTSVNPDAHSGANWQNQMNTFGSGNTHGEISDRYNFNFDQDAVTSTHSNLAVSSFVFGCAYKIYQSKVNGVDVKNSDALPFSIQAGKTDDMLAIQLKIHF